MTIKVGDKEYCIDGYSNISELQKVMTGCYQQGKTDAISEMRKLEQEHYCPCKGTDCCYKYSDESCITCYLDEIEGKERIAMSDYTEKMTVEEMREEIAEMLQSGEGFISTDEKLLEYVDDFISKVRKNVIAELKPYVLTNMDDEQFLWLKVDELNKLSFAEQLKEQTDD